MVDRLRRELENLSKVEGITPADVMNLPEPLRSGINKIMHEGSVTLSEFAAELKLEIAETRQLGQMLIEKGFLVATEAQADGEILYHARFAKSRKRVRGLPRDIWEKLDSAGWEE
jgi:hypothetical protein